MTKQQHEALKALEDRNLGCVMINGRYVWPSHIRQSQEIALEVLAHMEKPWAPVRKTDAYDSVPWPL